MSAAEVVKLRDALFKSPFQAFRQHPMDEGDDYREWDLEPLLGPSVLDHDQFMHYGIRLSLVPPRTAHKNRMHIP
jgi:hypothetical protein